MEGAPRLIGREQERAVLLTALARGAAGDPSLILLHGEPGIGKTSLVRDLARSAHREGDRHVLLGTCLRFGAEITSYVPFHDALARWLRATDPQVREKVLPGVESVAQAMPALADAGSGAVLFQFGSVIDLLQQDRPTLLVLDDIQWCDPSSLDLLSYLVAGLDKGRRLNIVATYRDTELAEGHRLHGWLADALRLPFVERLGVSGMDLWSIEQLVDERTGSESEGTFAQEVFTRSQGNPYLAELLIAARDHGPRQPARVGDPLGDALAASWHRLSPSARKVTQLLSVAGRPVTFSVIHQLTGRRGLEFEEVDRAVTEAIGQGIVRLDRDADSLWFRHPLLAEVIESTLPPWDVARAHGDYADVWRDALGVNQRDRANHLALHLMASHQDALAFEWSLEAAAQAAAVHAREEEATHLSHAVDLLPVLSKVARADVHEVDLRLRAARACDDAADYHRAVEQYDRALALIDRATDPLRASRIILALHRSRELAGSSGDLGFLSQLLQALELTEGFVGVPERAMALAQLAYQESFKGDGDAAWAHAQAAVDIAEGLGSPVALTWALIARAQTRYGTEEGIADAERALSLVPSDDPGPLLERATNSLSNSYQSAGRWRSAADVTEASYLKLRDAGRPNEAAMIGFLAAQWNLALGRWDRVRPLVRELLTLARSRSVAASARCITARLAALEGDGAVALQHLRRAQELMPVSAPVGDDIVTAQVQVNIAVGQPLRALHAIEEAMAEVVQIDPIAADEWLEWAARAAADVAESGAPGDRRGGALARLERIEALRGDLTKCFQPAGPMDSIHPALGSLYAAERAQCQGDRIVQAELWAAACDATSRADMRYEHGRALYYSARALFGQRHGRPQAIEALSRARTIANELGAMPLTRNIDALAAQTHTHLPAPARADSLEQTLIPDHLVGLTSREREVLGGIVAGETYRQIATRLFITEKTVSAHVSNMLAKTGTANRIELSAFAQRLQPKSPTPQES